MDTSRDDAVFRILAPSLVPGGGTASARTPARTPARAEPPMPLGEADDEELSQLRHALHLDTARASPVMSDIEAAFGKYASRPTARSRASRTPRREALGTPPAADEMRQRAAVAIEEAERLADARVDKIRREAAETVERAEAERVDIDRRTRLLAEKMAAERVSQARADATAAIDKERKQLSSSVRGRARAYSRAAGAFHRWRSSLAVSRAVEARLRVGAEERARQLEREKESAVSAVEAAGAAAGRKRELRIAALEAEVLELRDALAVAKSSAEKAQAEAKKLVSTTLATKEREWAARQLEQEQEGLAAAAASERQLAAAIQSSLAEHAETTAALKQSTELALQRQVAEVAARLEEEADERVRNRVAAAQARAEAAAKEEIERFKATVAQQVLEAKRRSRKETEMRLASTIRLADDAVTTAKSLHTLQARRPALRA